MYVSVFNKPSMKCSLQRTRVWEHIICIILSFSRKLKQFSLKNTRICAIFSFRILALKILDISRHNSDMYFRFVKTKIFKSKVQVPFQFKLKLTQKLPLQIRMVDRFSPFLPSLPGSRIRFLHSIIDLIDLPVGILVLKAAICSWIYPVLLPYFLH